MSRARNFAAGLLLRSRIRFRSLQKVPVIGGSLHRLSHWLLPGQLRVWSRVRQGPAKDIWLEVNPRTGQGYIQGTTEAATQRRLAEYLKPGMVFYDLGANIGLFSLLAARIVGPQGRVFSFEPDFETAQRLKSNVEKNSCCNITIVEAGVWSSTRKVAFIASDSTLDRGFGRFTLETANIAGKELPCYALDDFMSTAPPPNAIKCDVEGAELEVFRGGEHLIATHRPWIICEIHSAENGEAVLNLFRRFGYSVDAVDSNHLLAFP
ncbi:MAG TPA: FkbM family methyltransferase [Verrucomicrobiae bacterium]|nr:FkbM family methyltransferase [Verrucomicrobiae bacterium]